MSVACFRIMNVLILLFFSVMLVVIFDRFVLIIVARRCGCLVVLVIFCLLLNMVIRYVCWFWVFMFFCLDLY